MNVGMSFKISLYRTILNPDLEKKNRTCSPWWATPNHLVPSEKLKVPEKSFHAKISKTQIKILLVLKTCLNYC